MLAVDRRKIILDRIVSEQSVTVSELASHLNVTEETIRRDLLKLENNGLINRVHGGATAKENVKEDLPYTTPNIQHTKEKETIADLAVKLISNGASLMADASTTVFELIKRIDNSLSEATVITNSSYLLYMFNSTSINFISTGGTLRKNSFSLVGSLAMQSLSKFNADYAVFSCKAISQNGFAMDSNELDVDIKREMMRRAKKIILLVDSSKFDQTSFVNLFSVDEIDIIVTDTKPNIAWREYLEKHHIKLIVKE